MATAKQKVPTVPNEVPIALIEHGNNPRTMLDGPRLVSLTDSVRQHGILQPIRVRQLPDERYQIIAGHRRFEAAREAGLTVIPVYVSPKVDDDDAFVQSLVENIQREDLDPLDEARAYRVLLDRTDWTQVELGTKVGKAQSTVSNILGLLELTPSVQEQLSAGDITVGHAKVLSVMPPEKQEAVAKDVVDRKLSVRETEAMAARERQIAQSAADRAVAVESHATNALALLTEQTVDVNATVVVYDRDIAAKLQEMGWTFAREVNWRTDSSHPKWGCECDAWWFQTTADGQRAGTLTHCCVVKAHERAAKKDEEAAERARQKDNDNLLNRQRRAAVKELRAVDAEQVTDDGLRLTLYTLLMSTESFNYGRDERRSSFVKRHGGSWSNDVTKSGDEIWMAIEGLSSKDLVGELLEYVVDVVVPNVFTQSEFYNRTHSVARAWMVKQLSLDPSLVWGKPLADSVIEEDEESTPVEGWDDGDEEGPDIEDLAERVAELTPPQVAAVELATGVDLKLDAIDEANLDAQEAVESDMFDALKEAGLADTSPVDPEPFVIDGSPVNVTDSGVFVDPGDRPLEGEKVVVTGVIMGMTRDEVMTAVVNAGGQWGESVNKNTTLLVVGEKPGGAKTRKAEELGIQTLTESEFRERLAK